MPMLCPETTGGQLPVSAVAPTSFLSSVLRYIGELDPDSCLVRNSVSAPSGHPQREHLLSQALDAAAARACWTLGGSLVSGQADGRCPLGGRGVELCRAST